jgi:membrane-associated phospholipid phosphatase
MPIASALSARNGLGTYVMFVMGNSKGEWETRRPCRGAIAQAMPPGGIKTRDWLYVAGQLGLVAGIELSDDWAHALAPQANAASGLANAVRVMDFERAHDLWIEPGLQRFFASTHHVFGRTIGWNEVRPVFDAIYGQGHVLFTAAFAFWLYFFRRPLFAFVRNIFLLTTLLAVVLYEAFPLAPPRLAQDLWYDGHPFHFLDAVFGDGGLKLDFNEYAAMPSVHVAWALIVGLTVWWAVRPTVVRVLGLIYPFLMVITVIVTGNHYLADGLGAMVVVGFAFLLAVALGMRRYRRSFTQTVRCLYALRYRRTLGVVAATPAQADENGRVAA